MPASLAAVVALVATFTACQDDGSLLRSAAATTVNSEAPPESAPTSPESDDPCAQISDALERLDRVDAGDATGFAEALDGVARQLRDAAVSGSLRDEAETIASLFATFADTFSELADARLTADAETTDIIDDVVKYMPAFLGLMGGRTVLTSMVPEFVELCDVDRSETAAQQDQFFEFADAVQRLTESDLGTGEGFDSLQQMTSIFSEGSERMRAGSASGLVKEYDNCFADPSAQTVGDNSGCDALYEACDARTLLACNDLYWISRQGSAYEAFAATCGERIKFGDDGFGGFCDVLDDP